MPGKLLQVVILASGLFAQDNGKQAYINLRLDTSGHGQLSVEITGVEGVEQFFTEPVRAGLFHGCDKPALRRNTISALCRNLLTPNGPNLTGAIRVDSLFQPLYDLGIDDLIVFVHVPDAAQNPATPETAHWTQILPEGKGIRYGHVLVQDIRCPRRSRSNIQAINRTSRSSLSARSAESSSSQLSSPRSLPAVPPLRSRATRKPPSVKKLSG